MDGKVNKRLRNTHGIHLSTGKHFIKPPQPKHCHLYPVQVSLLVVQETVWRLHRSANDWYVFSHFLTSFSSLPSLIFLQIFFYFIFPFFSYIPLPLTFLHFFLVTCLSAAFQEVLRQLLLRKRFSQESTQVAALRMRPDNSSLRCNRNTPLNVILSSDTTVKLTLLEVWTFLKRVSNGHVTLRIRKKFTTSNVEEILYVRSTLNERGICFFWCWFNIISALQRNRNKIYVSLPYRRVVLHYLICKEIR